MEFNRHMLRNTLGYTSIAMTWLSFKGQISYLHKGLLHKDYSLDYLHNTIKCRLVECLKNRMLPAEIALVIPARKVVQEDHPME